MSLQICMIILLIYTVFFVAFGGRVCSNPKRLPRQTFECSVQTVVTMENWLVKKNFLKISRNSGSGSVASDGRGCCGHSSRSGHLY